MGGFVCCAESGSRMAPAGAIRLSTDVLDCDGGAAFSMDMYSTAATPSFPLRKAAARRPWCTYAFIAANIALMVALFAMGGWAVDDFQHNQLIGPPTSVLQRFSGSRAAIVDDGEHWRLFTSIWLHAGIVHLLLNMGALYRAGSDIELEHGLLTFLSLYLFSGLCGSFASAVFGLSNQVTVGASGALFGLFGSDLAYFVHYYADLGPSRWTFFAVFLVSSIVGLGLGLHPMLNNFAHIGGFIGGVLFSMVCLSRFQTIRGQPWLKYNSRTLALCVAFAVLALAYAGGLAYLLFVSKVHGYTICPWCRYLDCWETSWWTCPA
ncbi:rhomboid protease [Plasmodiophora brassicae]